MGTINKERIELLRKEIKKEGIDCYIVVTDDFHASEYVGDFFKEREWLSGFTGTNGTLAVTENFAGLWTDGRYFLQGEEELKGSGIELMKDGEEGVPEIQEFIAEMAKEKSAYVIGYDGRTINYQYGKRLRKYLEDTLGKTVKNNVRIDLDIPGKLWTDRPKMSSNPVWKLEEKYCGKTSEEKLEELRRKAFKFNTENEKAGLEDKALQTAKTVEKEVEAETKHEIPKEHKSINGVLLTALDEIAWLYNLRGSDIDYTPVFMAYSIITKEEAILYTDCFNGMSREEVQLIKPEWLRVKPYLDVYKDVVEFDGAIYMDQETVNETLAFSAKNPVFGESKIALDKAVKNVTEIENEKVAHIKDGVALTKAIYWLKQKAKTGEIYKETELSVEKYLTELRKAQGNFIDLSFASIVATGEHGAIVHYEPTAESNRHIEDGFLLIDTGAHYLEGTTDVTRTVSIGEVTEEMREHYTRVLKGHIDVAIAKFDREKTGPYLDEIARRSLKEVGLDFNHGTGHGVGYILNVHEGPNSIRRPRKDGCADPKFYPGMITSNEPGLYLEGKYGIRIENLILAKMFDSKLDPPDSKESDSRGINAEGCNVQNLKVEGMMEFENLTLVPYDRASIKWEMLDEKEKNYLAEYAEKVYEEMESYLTEEEKAWLEEETRKKLCVKHKK